MKPQNIHMLRVAPACFGYTSPALRCYSLRTLLVSFVLVSGFVGLWTPSMAVAATYYVATDGKDDNPGTFEKPFRTTQKGASVLTSEDTLLIRWTPTMTVAATYYVATDGKDDNPGTREKPFRTTQKGTSVLAPGDTLLIRAGSWGAITTRTHTLPSGTSWVNAPRIVAFPGETVTLSGIGISANKGYLIFDGLVIDGEGTVRETVYISNGGHHIRVQNSEIKNAHAQGILIPKESGGFNEFINVDVHHNGTRDRYDHGFYIEAANNLVEYSRIHHNKGYGIHNYSSGDTSASNNVYRYNDIYDNCTGIGICFGAVLSSGSNSRFHNNRVSNNMKAGGVQAAWNATGMIIENNMIYNNAPEGVRILSEATGTIVRNNLISNHQTMIRNDAESSTTLSDNVFTGEACVRPN